MKYIILIASLLITVSVSAQDSKNHNDTAINGKIYFYVEQMPAPRVNMHDYLQKHLHYPDSARKNNIEGKVLVSFLVTKKGKIDSVSVIKGIGGGCDEEARRVIQNMPRWRPGKSKGQPVIVRFTQPINFSLN